ncbi:MAG: hypothetical protein LUG23_07865 [Oscillospiraceae bacterium]|nr:hypothetical protein [Oscillospiraceae bacterium]
MRVGDVDDVGSQVAGENGKSCLPIDGSFDVSLKIDEAVDRVDVLGELTNQRCFVAFFAVGAGLDTLASIYQPWALPCPTRSTALTCRRTGSISASMYIICYLGKKSNIFL